jgi:F-type H+-transporting ATPase subunit b
MKRLAILLVFLFALTVPAVFVYAAEEAAHGETAEHGETLAQTIGKWVNFAALVAILYYFLNRSLRVQDKFKAEAQEIQQSIESARKAKEEAEHQLQAMDQRLQQMHDEIARIKERAMQEAEEEKKLILESAQKEAHRIVEMAHRDIDNEVRLARKQLRKQVADLAVDQGKKIVEQEINDQDQRRMIDSYIEDFGK